jgi:RNA polymerase sigma factor FliA
MPTNPYEKHTKSHQDAIAIQYLPAVKAMAYRLKERLPSSIEASDLISIGAEELIKLARRYDESLNDNFWGYGKKRVYGAMLDYLRSLDLMSRSNRKLMKDIEKAIIAYVSDYDEEPSDQYLADELDEPIEKIQKSRYSTEIYALMPIDEQVQALGDPSTVDKVQQDQLISLITDILQTMNERDQMIMQLYYFEELSLKEISSVLEITESRISQIIKAVTRKIRDRVA